MIRLMLAASCERAQVRGAQGTPAERGYGVCVREALPGTECVMTTVMMTSQEIVRKRKKKKNEKGVKFHAKELTTMTVISFTTSRKKTSGKEWALLWCKQFTMTIISFTIRRKNLPRLEPAMTTLSLPVSFEMGKRIKGYKWSIRAFNYEEDEPSNTQQIKKEEKK